MIIFSNAMHVLGLLGAPRRTELGTAPYVPDEWNGHLLRVSIGGAILLVSVIMYVVTMIRTATQKERVAVGAEIPIAQSLRDPQLTPVWLDSWKPWLIGTGLLILLAYGPQLFEQISNASFSSPGFSP